MTLTVQLIDAAKSPKGGWSKGQLALVGVGWPPPKGWKSEVAGRDFTPETIASFCRWHSQPTDTTAEQRDGNGAATNT